ncbi:MAG: hypothetical protein IK120_04840 [Muribaculaceae bacterium]|nr:hypothetical protein [Muribaculaceae bacterium]
MDIPDRLKFFLDSQQITNSVFADQCDIPRPTVSQILNGRNKKISNEIISKIHSAFPELSVHWLMFGEGEMMPADSITPPVATVQPDRLPFDSDDAGASSVNAPRIHFPQTQTSPVSNIAVSTAQGRGQTAFEPTNRMVDSADKRHSSKGPRVVRIIVYYNDNSFQEFSPKD